MASYPVPFHSIPVSTALCTSEVVVSTSFSGNTEFIIILEVSAYNRRSYSLSGFADST